MISGEEEPEQKRRSDFLFRDEFRNEILEIQALSFLFLLILFLIGENWRKSSISK